MKIQDKFDLRDEQVDSTLGYLHDALSGEVKKRFVARKTDHHDLYVMAAALKAEYRLKTNLKQVVLDWADAQCQHT